MTAEKQPSSIDSHVGHRIKVRRTLLRMSQGKLGDRLGVTFQQVQKYEKGTSRVGAGQLFEIAKLLKVEPNFFFEGLIEHSQPEVGFAEAQSMIAPIGIEETVEGMALHRAFARIRSQKMRRRIVELVTTIADSISV